MAYLLKTGNSEKALRGSVIGAVLYDCANASGAESVLARSEGSVYADAGAGLNGDLATSLLNAGAKAVAAHSIEHVRALESAGIPLQRILLLQTPSSATTPNFPEFSELAGVVAADHEIAVKLRSETTAINASSRVVPVFEAASSEDELVSLLLESVQTDRQDGLITTVVTSWPRRRVLGTCYSSKESLKEAVRERKGIYQSRKRGLWVKGLSSGAVQVLRKVAVDCDGDAVEFVVEQAPPGFCHNNTNSCFGSLEGFGGLSGLDALEETVASRKKQSPVGSYTNRLFNEAGLLEAKIKEEADELCEAQTKDEVAWEAADLLYFVAVKLAKHGMSFADVEANLDRKALKVTRRKGDAKAPYVQHKQEQQPLKAVKQAQQEEVPTEGPITIAVVDYKDTEAVAKALRRPAQSSNAFELSKPIVADVRARGDEALLEYTAKFEKAQLASPVMNAPFPKELMELEPALKQSIDLACENVKRFHAAQIGEELVVETCAGVVCRRFSRPIARVGLYVPGGTAILPSTAIHLGVPAKVAGCQEIVLATPPRTDGTPSPEVLYVAHKIGASQIVLAGGAQAVAAMAYGTASVKKVDKILGPGNQFVTAAKMLCSTDVNAQVSIDMPAGPSEVLVVADKKANKKFVVSDLLSQAEHGADSQVVLISIGWDQRDVEELQAELHKQAVALPRCNVVRKSIAHSVAVNVPDTKTAFDLSNQYAPEHLILQVEDASSKVKLVNNAGSVFVGALSPESCGDYTSGTNHTLPTYGYANQYSGVNTDSYLKYITSQELSSVGLESIGDATVTLAEREGLQAHANAVKVRLTALRNPGSA